MQARPSLEPTRYEVVHGQKHVTRHQGMLDRHPQIELDHSRDIIESCLSWFTISKIKIYSWKFLAELQSRTKSQV